MANNRITKVAIVGAGGNVGTFITKALLQTGQHSVIALTRIGSTSILPNGVSIREIDYGKSEILVEALRGIEALVITLSGQATFQGVEEKLIRAASEAGVPWILPNEWSPDSAHEGLIRDVFLFGFKVATRKLIEQIGTSAYIAVVTGFWYEYSLGKADNYGIDFANRKAVLYDDGETKISTSTWPQIGRAVASLLSLPINPEGDDKASLSQFKNQMVYINSFTVSQKDMLASALRVTQTRESDWTIVKNSSRESYAIGMKEMQEGKLSAKFLYARVFYPGPDGGGDFENTKGTSNSLLGLPEEDIDEATRVAVDRQAVNRGH